MQRLLESYGYPVTVQGHRLLAGNPGAAYLVAARRREKSAVHTLLEMARTMPESQRQKVCFAISDCFPKGLENQFVFCLDRVGQGDNIVMIPTSRLRKDRKKLTSLYKACGYFGKKSLLLQEKKSLFFPCFPWGVTIRTQEKGNTALDETNVNILRAALTTYICCCAVEEERKQENETV